MLYLDYQLEVGISIGPNAQSTWLSYIQKDLKALNALLKGIQSLPADDDRILTSKVFQECIEAQQFHISNYLDTQANAFKMSLLTYLHNTNQNLLKLEKKFKRTILQEFVQLAGSFIGLKNKFKAENEAIIKGSQQLASCAQTAIVKWFYDSEAATKNYLNSVKEVLIELRSSLVATGGVSIDINGSVSASATAPATKDGQTNEKNATEIQANGQPVVLGKKS